MPLAYMASLLLLGRDCLCGSKLKFEKEKHHEQQHQIHTRTWLSRYGIVSIHIVSRSGDPFAIQTAGSHGSA